MKTTIGGTMILFTFCLLFGISEGFQQPLSRHDGEHATVHQSNRVSFCRGPKCTKTVFVSVATNQQDPECRLRVTNVPIYSSLYDVMLFAEQQFPPALFNFSVTFHDKYGHFIEGINNVVSNNPFFWCVYNSLGIPLSVGVDFTYPANRDAYIWNYENTTETHCSEYRGPCLRKSDDLLHMEDTYNVEDIDDDEE